jgi:hypothetical protein
MPLQKFPFFSDIATLFVVNEEEDAAALAAPLQKPLLKTNALGQLKMAKSED